MAPRVLGPASRRTGRVANRRPWLLPPRPAHAGIFQLASAAEIVHAALGLVGGSPATAAMQWAGRSNVLFGVVAAVPQVQASAAVGAMLLAWALSEVVRYPWYAATTAGICPPWLTWLRRAAGTVFWRGGPAAAAKRFLPLPLPACLHPPPPLIPAGTQPSSPSTQWAWWARCQPCTQRCPPSARAACAPCACPTPQTLRSTMQPSSR